MSTLEREFDHGEWAALYVAGALTTAERGKFEQALADDPATADEFKRLAPVIEGLAEIADEVTPPSRVFEGLMQRVNEEKAFEASLAKGIVLRRANDAEWEQTRIPGIQRRFLSIDRESRRQTVLLRADAGAVMPRHPHPTVEECLLLEGDLTTCGITLRPGDYLRFPANIGHGNSRTRNGCILLIMGALDEDTHAAAMAAH